MEKLDLKYGEKVRVKQTGSNLDGQVVRVVGVSVRHVNDFYILEFLECETRFLKDGTEYGAFVLPEGCMERVQNNP